jgi:DNA-binding NtrC family response regulator
MKIKNVLIADRDMRMCRVLGRIINRLNFEYFSAHEQHTFKSLCSEIGPDIIMLSLDMAEQDNLLEYLADQNSQATIILLNNMDEDELYRSEMVGQVSRLNIGGFLRKPIEIDAVRSTLEGLRGKGTDTIKKSQQLSDAYRVHYCYTPAL